MKAINTTIIVIFYTTLLSAQRELSLSFGINRSNLIWTNFEESGWKYKTGNFYGLRNVYFSNAKFEVSTEIQYSNKGWIIESLTPEKQTFTYIDAIHTITYKPMDNIGFYGGINTAYLINRNKIIGDRLTDFGLLAGFSTSLKQFKLFTHYNLGLLNNELNTPGLEELGIKALNSNLQFGVNYSIYKNKTNEKEDQRKNFNTYEVGLLTQNFSTFKAMLKKQIADKKFIRYDISFNEIYIGDLKSEDINFTINGEIGFGIEKRNQFGDIEFLTGPMYRLGYVYILDTRFSVYPFFGYILGAQYNWKSKLNIGMELIPGISLNYNSSIISPSTLSANVSFVNRPNFFITYKFNKS